MFLEVYSLDALTQMSLGAALFWSIVVLCLLSLIHKLIDLAVCVFNRLVRVAGDAAIAIYNFSAWLLAPVEEPIAPAPKRGRRKIN